MQALPKQVYNGNTAFTLMGALRGQYQCLWIFKLVWAIFGIGNLKVFLRGPSPVSGWNLVAGLWVAPVPVTQLLDREAQTVAKPALQSVVLPECFPVQAACNQYRRARHQHCVYTVGEGTDLTEKDFLGWNKWLWKGFVRLEHRKLTANTVPDFGGRVFSLRLAKVC